MTPGTQVADAAAGATVGDVTGLLTDGLGARIVEARERDGKTRQDIAEVLGLDIAHIEAIESGERAVSAFEFGLLNETFGWDVRDLLGMPGSERREFIRRLRSLSNPEHGGLDDAVSESESGGS